MHGKGVVLEVEFQEVSSERYSQMFTDALRDHFGKELSQDQLNLLAQAIEKSRLDGQAPVDLVGNLVENWEVIFKKDVDIPFQECPRCDGKRETAYDIKIGDKLVTVSEAYHLCDKHHEAWDEENYQCMC